MERRLHEYGRVEGLVIGAHGEGSKDLLKLINRMVERVVVRLHHTLGYVSAYQLGFLGIKIQSTSFLLDF